MSKEIRFGKTFDDEDVTVPLQKLHGKHCLFRGKTGSGKSLLLTNVLAQLTTEGDSMVAVIDLGGDLFMFNHLKESCERNGKRFRFFSLDEVDASESFDPFQSCSTLGGNPSRIANFIVGALSLCYPEGYGSSYYTRLNHSTIANAVQRLLDSQLPITVESLRNELSLMAREPRRQKEASEALFSLDQLANYPQLLPGNTESQTINISKSLQDGECVYLFIPALREPSTSRAIATAALWTIVNIAADRVKQGCDVRHAFIAVDECAQLFGSKAMEDVLTLCRKAHCQLLLAHQTSSQLVTRGGDMRAVVTDNTSIRIYSTLPTELDRKEILDHSLTVVKTRKSTTAKALGASVTMQEMELPGIEGNVCRESSGTFGHAILVRELGDGHHDPLPIVCIPPVSKEKYEELSSRPIPKRDVPMDRPQATVKPHVFSFQHQAILKVASDRRDELFGWKKAMGGERQ